MVRTIFTALFLLVASAASAASYSGDATASKLTFTAMAEGAEFTGGFARFSTTATFDPAKPATGSITATVDIASVDTANPQRDETLLGADWFASNRWPRAEFRTTAIQRNGTGFRAQGTLTIRTVTRPVVMDFSWTPAGKAGAARLQGVVKLQRLDFDLGQGDWRDTKYVGNDVLVKVDVRYVPNNEKKKT